MQTDLSAEGRETMGKTVFAVTAATKVLTDSRVEKRWCWGELAPCTHWDAADYMLPGNGFIPDQAVKVEVTGRKVRHDVPKLHGVPCVRVAVTFVGDGEPDLVVGGWALASSLEATYVLGEGDPWF